MKETGLSRVSKNLIIGQVEKELSERPVFFITQHAAVPATSLDKLRAKLRQANARYLAVKNSLGRRALEKVNLGKLSENLSGPCGIAFFTGDPVVPSKILTEFARENEKFKIQQACLSGEVITADQVKYMAGLPSREVLIARVVGGIQAPLSRLAGALSGTMKKIVRAISEHA